MKTYCIYKHTLPNQKVYIGKTCDVKRRWRACNYVGNWFFYNAIQEYGWENITHEILEDNLTLEEANEKEKYYVALYQSANSQYGYNLRAGGAGGGAIASKTEKFKERYKRVYQYTLEGDFIAEWDNLTLAAESCGGVNKITGISQCCNGKRKTAYGFQWRYEKFDHLSKQELTGVKKRIVQKDLEGNVIQIYNSVSEAVNALGMKSHTSIGNVLNGRTKTAYGFLWEELTI